MIHPRKKMSRVEEKGGRYMAETIPRMMTIRAVAATGVLPEHALRMMARQGQLPCIYIGKKCLVNYDQLLAYLHTQSQHS